MDRGGWVGLVLLVKGLDDFTFPEIVDDARSDGLEVGLRLFGEHLVALNEIAKCDGGGASASCFAVQVDLFAALSVFFDEQEGGLDICEAGWAKVDDG